MTNLLATLPIIERIRNCIIVISCCNHEHFIDIIALLLSNCAFWLPLMPSLDPISYNLLITQTAISLLGLIPYPFILQVMHSTTLWLAL